MKPLACWACTVFIVLIHGSVPSLSKAASKDLVKAEIDRSATSFIALTEKSGFLSGLGHRHAILANDWKAEVCISNSGKVNGRVRVVIPTASLVIDTPEARRMGGWKNDLSESTRNSLQEKMLSSRYLSAADHPEIVFDSTEVDGGSEQVVVKGNLTLRGVTNPVSIPVDVQRREDGSVSMSSLFTIKQTDFGMEPESILGAVKVDDTIEIKFNGSAKPTNEPCQLEE